MTDRSTPEPCGFFCSPAIDKRFGGDDARIPPCSHRTEAHYSIDGENTGCTECEELADVAEMLRAETYSSGTINLETGLEADGTDSNGRPTIEGLLEAKADVDAQMAEAVAATKEWMRVAGEYSAALNGLYLELTGNSVGEFDTPAETAARIRELVTTGR